MEAHPLNETYSVCGMTFDIYAKTGRYKKDREDGYWFYGDDENEENPFQITGVNLVGDIELESADRVSIALFGKNGSFFLVFNHRNSTYKYYPEAVTDLIWSMIGCLRPIKNRINARRLLKASKTFTTTQLFSNVLRKVQAL